MLGLGLNKNSLYWAPWPWKFDVSDVTSEEQIWLRNQGNKEGLPQSILFFIILFLFLCGPSFRKWTSCFILAGSHSQGVKSAWLIMRKVSFSCLSWVTELCYWWGNPLTIPTLLFFQWVGLLLWKDFFILFFYTTTIFKSEWKCSEPTPNNILYVAKHTCLPLEIKTLSCISAFTCIYFYFQTQKPCPSFIYSLLTELAFSGHSRNLCFLHFCILLCFSNAFFSLFLFFSLLLFYLEKKGAVPVDTYTTCPAGSAKLQCKIMHLIKI